MTKLTNQNLDQRHKYHHLTTTLHLTLKMTTAQVVETSVTNNSLPHPEDHTKPITLNSRFPVKRKENLTLCLDIEHSSNKFLDSYKSLTYQT